jgi:hypothetical protein
MTKLDMIGESIEDKKIMKGIKENFIRTRKFNKARAKKAKRDKIKSFFMNVFIGLLVSGGLLLLMIIIGIIENFNF